MFHKNPLAILLRNEKQMLVFASLASAKPVFDSLRYGGAGQQYSPLIKLLRSLHWRSIIKAKENKILILSFVFPLSRTGEVLACAVCYGTKASSVTSALNMAIMSLLIVFLGILSCLAIFFWKVGKRIKMLEN